MGQYVQATKIMHDSAILYRSRGFWWKGIDKPAGRARVNRALQRDAKINPPHSFGDKVRERFHSLPLPLP
jgi:hypothetical protein